jgi:hypothetical protein
MVGPHLSYSVGANKLRRKLLSLASPPPFIRHRNQVSDSEKRRFLGVLQADVFAVLPNHLMCIPKSNLQLLCILVFWWVTTTRYFMR